MERFEYDPEKSRRNKERHGVSLNWARRLWRENHVLLPARAASGENRCFILAKTQGRCFMAVFTLRRRTIRLISCHRADRRLERIYESWLEAAEA
ncbi:MAG: BrnT family toxin [Elusimicrobia bacterium]|nr:BrnT family toxin [Elusimicrobiota bacterium]